MQEISPEEKIKILREQNLKEKIYCTACEFCKFSLVVKIDKIIMIIISSLELPLFKAACQVLNKEILKENLLKEEINFLV